MKTAMALIICGSISLPAAASPAYGDPFEGSGFVKDDWHVICDNTLTCRAAGYSREVAERRGSIMLSMPAGAKIPTAHVKLNYWDLLESETAKLQAQLRAADYKVSLLLNNQFYGTVSLKGDEGTTEVLTHLQTRQLIAQAQNHTAIAFRLGDYDWQISDKGMAAVLLKLDEVQGRVGTPLALVSQNNAKRQQLKPAKAKPVIKKAFVYVDKDNQSLAESTLSYFQDNIDKWVDIGSEELMGTKEVMGDCELINPETEVYQRMAEYDASMLSWKFIPVDEQHTLAVHRCWTGAYNFGSGYWLINHNNPSKAKLITLSGSEYSEGEIFAAHKGRGLGDCWSTTNWVWDGKNFVMSSELTTGLCRLIEAGGAWVMPTYVSEVVAP